MKLQNKVAIVTGSSSGIGQAIAIGMAREGAAVTIDYVGKGADDAETTARQIIADGGRAIAVEGDISNQAQVQQLVSKTVQEFGRLDVMVCNAGIETKVPILDVPLDLWNKTVAVNLTGPFLCGQEAAKQMVRQNGGGRIINISSVHEDLPMPTNTPYCATKGGLRMLMRSMAIELAEYGITVNNIGPGAIDTPMDAPLKAQPEKMKDLLDHIPLHRMGKPEEVADLAIFLASDESAYVTGSTYFIDGGMLRWATSL